MQQHNRYKAAWRQWRAFARKAAAVQSEVVLGALFFAVVPFAVARRLIGGGRAPKAGWLPRPPTTDELEAARRQF